jgi:hypothetical protein
MRAAGSRPWYVRGLSLSPCPWDGFAPGTVSFCEDRLCGWVAEPANAWSNLAYVVVGFYLLYLAHRDRRVPLYLCGATSILVGFGSFLFHISGTFFGEFFDLSAMFLIGSLMVTMEARRFVTLSMAKTTMLYLAISLGSMLVVLLFRTVGIVLFGIQVALIYVSNIYWKSRKAKVVHRHAFRLGATFAVAFGIWLLDLFKVVCSPSNHVFTGHSAWHILTALCLYFFYKHQEQFVPSRIALPLVR